MTSESNLGQLTTVVRRHRRMIIAAGLLGAVPVALAMWLVPPRYTAKAEIVVDAIGPLSVQQDPVSQQRLDAAAILTEVTELRSSDLLRQVIKTLRSDPAFHAPAASTPPHPHPGAPSAVTTQGWAANALAQTGAFLLRVRETLDDTQAPPSLHSFEKHLQVFQEGGSHVVAVTFTSADPDRAALAANTLVQMHLQQEKQEAQRATARALAWIDQQIPEVKKTAQSLQNEARAYGAGNDLPTLGDPGLIKSEVAQLSRELVTAEADLAAKTDRAKTLGALPASLAIPGLSELRAREISLLESRTAAAYSMSAANPMLQRLDGQLRAVRREIAAMTARASGAFKDDVAAETAKVDLIRKRLHGLQSAVNEPKLQDLEHSAAFQTGLVDSLMKRQEALREQSASYTPGVRMLSLAMPPDRPSSLNPVLFFPPVLILSFVGATMIGLLRDTADSTLHTERELYEKVGIPCIGTVPKVRLRGRRSLYRLLIDEPYCTYAEAIRFAAAGLSVAKTRAPSVVILVTSAVPGEGKTTFAVSLAAVAATMGKRVLLMDFDLRHPSVQREIGPITPPRVHDGMTRPSTETGIQTVPDIGLDLVTSRQKSTEALKLFAGDDMATRIARLRTQYDCVIIDSAPLLAMAEARLIAGLADQIVVAVKWAATRTDMVRNAVDMLRAPGSPAAEPQSVFAVITQVDLKKHARQCAGDLAEIAMRYRSYYRAAAG